MIRSASTPDSAVAITGLGVVAPAGVGLEPFWRALLDDRSALAETPASKFGAPLPSKSLTLTGQGFDASNHADPRIVRRISGFSAAAIIAAREAFEQAGRHLDDELLNSQRQDAAVVLGTTFGSSAYHFEYYDGLFSRGLKAASPLLFSECVLNAASGHISQQLGLRGPGLTVVGGEDTGLQALLAAADLLGAAGAAFAVAGAAEESCDLVHAWEAQSGWVGEESGNPLAQEPRLCAYGEGAAVFILEAEEQARGRGAVVLARLLGAAGGRRRRGEPECAAAIKALRQALELSGVLPDEIAFAVSGADGGGLDRLELEALAEVLDPGRPIVVCAPKRWVGEAFAFSSAAQALVAAQGLRSRRLPSAKDGAARLPGRWRLPRDGEELAAGPALVLSSTRHGGATALVLAAGD